VNTQIGIVNAQIGHRERVMISSRDRNASSTSPTRTDVGRVVVRTAECSRRTALVTTPAAHRTSAVTTRRIVVIVARSSSLVRRSFPRDDEADARRSHNSRDVDLGCHSRGGRRLLVESSLA
jgi:hypothetical protein